MIKTIAGKTYDSDALMLEILTTSKELRNSLHKPIPSVVESKKKEKKTAQEQVDKCRKALREARSEYKKKQKEYTNAKRGDVSNDNEEVGNLMFKKANLVNDFKYAFCKMKKGVVGLKYSEEMRKGKAKMKGNTPTQSKPTTQSKPDSRFTSTPPPAKSGGVLGAMGFGKSN